MAKLKNFKEAFISIYGNDKLTIDRQIKRYRKLEKLFINHFSSNDWYFFSTPGRTEIGGNHTDHNNGRILAAAVNLDSIAVAARNKNKRVILYSEGYDKPMVVNLNDEEPKRIEKGTTSALIRGIASKLSSMGYKVGGFDAVMTSEVPIGSGLSSSASVEVLIGTIFNYLFNDRQISAETLAKVGQYAENRYFGKSCGLMDQMVCAIGGIISIDFKNPEKPQVTEVNFDFCKQKYHLIVVNTGGSHVDLSDDYSIIPREMRSVANIFNVEKLRDIDYEDFLNNLPGLRNRVGDRALLRTLHFLEENDRVLEQVDALNKNNFQKFLNLVKVSGNSSFKWLQNIYSIKNVREQGVALALALTEKYLAEIKAGACRVHGGGFAGTIQVFLPDNNVEEYTRKMEKIFGNNSVLVLNIRSAGTICLNLM